MILKAYAKVNLGLKILGKRPDRYHNIETILQPINFFDLIELTAGQGTRTYPLIVFSSNLPPYGRTNICFKAAELFLSWGVSRYAPTIAGVKIKLKKQVWIGAGLGGGSSCAAQILIGMNKLFGNPLTQKALFDLALKIGSDVPFFIKGAPAYVQGRGEIVTPLPSLAQPLWFVLVYPKIQISTKWAYAQVKNYLTKEIWDFKILKDYFLNKEIENLAKSLRNDFEPLIFEKYPELQKIKIKLLELGALGVSLSGSGSCIYGIFKKEDEKFKKAFPEFDVRVAEAV